MELGFGHCADREWEKRIGKSAEFIVSGLEKTGWINDRSHNGVTLHRYPVVIQQMRTGGSDEYQSWNGRMGGEAVSKAA